jgi:hypothetical protein
MKSHGFILTLPDKVFNKKNAILFLYSFKRYQNFLLKIEILGFYFKSLKNRDRMLKNHKIKYLGVFKYAKSEKHIKIADNEYLEN